nr:TPA_asm: m24.5 ORF [Murid betaherpesvirus 1]DBA07941.1 TPA_asm: m24.5 ORF [Murid betaherpesvirus 1]
MSSSSLSSSSPFSSSDGMLNGLYVLSEAAAAVAELEAGAWGTPRIPAAVASADDDDDVVSGGSMIITSSSSSSDESSVTNIRRSLEDRRFIVRVSGGSRTGVRGRKGRAGTGNRTAGTQTPALVILYSCTSPSLGRVRMRRWIRRGKSARGSTPRASRWWTTPRPRSATCCTNWLMPPAGDP